MSSHKKNRCVCEICHSVFRSKDKFKKLCSLHNKMVKEIDEEKELPEDLDIDEESDNWTLDDIKTEEA